MPSADAQHNVTVVLATFNGERFLPEQLASIAAQSLLPAELLIVDDGSTDATADIVAEFARSAPLPVRWEVNATRLGYADNFLRAASRVTTALVAFSDQDDVWHADKLTRALAVLATAPAGAPALYCGRTELMTEDGRCYGLSPLFRRPPSFRNALVQNLGGGNTMVFNRAAKTLIEAAGAQEVVLHDWWLYQLVSAAGGAVLYDRQPMLSYRQHPANLIGSNQGRQARLLRIHLMLGGRFRDWNETNIAALRRLPERLITPDNRRVLELFAAARSAALPKRLARLRQSGVYRQTFLGNLGLLAAALLNRL